MNTKVNNYHSCIFNIGFGALAVIFIITIAIISIIFNSATTAQSGETEGYRISPPLSLGTITNVAESRIEWEAETPDGTSIIIATAVTESNDEIPNNWSPAAKGGPIPDIKEDESLVGKFLWTKQILETANPEITPKLYSLTETIKPQVKVEGYRISPEFDFSGPEKVKDSRIFWQADERFDGDISVEVGISYDGGNNWNDWQTVVNGGNIPGLEPGTSLARVKIKTKTSFVGGPDFYPSLENIKIFLELE